MQESQWSKLSSIAEIISSVAIVITLGYLAVQTSQNTSAVQSSSRQASLNNELWYIEMQINNPWMITGNLPFKDTDLSDIQIRQQNVMYVALFRMRENLYFQFKNGVIDKESWGSYQSVFVSFLKTVPTMRKSWDLVSPTLNANFVAEINKEIQ